MKRKKIEVVGGEKPPQLDLSRMSIREWLSAVRAKWSRTKQEMVDAIEQGARFQGVWEMEHKRRLSKVIPGMVFNPSDWDNIRDGWLYHDQVTDPNVLPTEGLNRILNIIFGSTGKSAANIQFVGLFKNNVTPAAGDTAAAKLGSGGDYGELQDPADFDAADDGTTTAATGEKPGYSPAAAASGVITNAAAKAHFVMAASITVYGSFLSDVASCATPGSAVLTAAKKFATSRAVVADDELSITYQITATSS